jgi:hypothetical protein
VNNKITKGFKAFTKDMTCRNFKFEVGKTYEHDGDLSLCAEEFHFCQNAFDVYNYSEKSSEILIAEVEALGEVKTDGDKSVTNRLKVVRLLSDVERLELWINRTNSGHRNSGDWNSGDCNSGSGNSGNWNSGNWNSGDCNSGDCNSGNWNSGDCNSGDCNSGNWNSGHRNSGNWNSGNGNSGNWNSGNWNSGNWNSGMFNTTDPTVRLFNKDSGLTFDSPVIQRLIDLKSKVKPILTWVASYEMTEQEKNDHPEHKTTEGYLKNTGRNDFSAWNNPEDAAFLRSLPGFDAEILKQITGLDLSDKIEVTVNGAIKKISKVDAKGLGLIE